MPVPNDPLGSIQNGQPVLADDWLLVGGASHQRLLLIALLPCLHKPQLKSAIEPKQDYVGVVFILEWYDALFYLGCACKCKNNLLQLWMHSEGQSA